MSYNDVDGYQVLTPLARPGGLTVLVNRGWVPFLGSRAETAGRLHQGQRDP